MTREEIYARLRAMREEGYRDFQSRLMPTVDKSRVLGVRMPKLRRLAKELARDPETASFLADLPHETYEENLLHGILICRIDDYEASLREIERFLPFVDNWAVCDLLAPRGLKTDLSALRKEIALWLTSAHPYTVRFAIGMLMRHFLREETIEDARKTVAAVDSEDYYVNMMCAWFFATALAVDEAATMRYFAPGILREPIRRMAIRKAKESFRVSPACKAAL